MPFGVGSGVGREMGVTVLDGVRGGYRRRERGCFRENVGRPIVTNGDGDALFPNYFAEDLLTYLKNYSTETKTCIQKDSHVRW